MTPRSVTLERIPLIKCEWATGVERSTHGQIVCDRCRIARAQRVRIVVHAYANRVTFRVGDCLGSSEAVERQSTTKDSNLAIGRSEIKTTIGILRPPG